MARQVAGGGGRLGRSSRDDRCACDAQAEADGGEGTTGPCLVAGEVAKGQARGDRQSARRRREGANRQRTQEEHAEHDRDRSADGHEWAGVAILVDADGEDHEAQGQQRQGGYGRSVHSGRRRRPAGQGSHDGHTSDGSRRPPRGRRGRGHGQQDDDRRRSRSARPRHRSDDPRSVRVVRSPRTTRRRRWCCPEPRR